MPFLRWQRELERPIPTPATITTPATSATARIETIPDPAKTSDVQASGQNRLVRRRPVFRRRGQIHARALAQSRRCDFWGASAGTQGFRHQNRSNAAFCDGHAESLADCYTNNADGAANVAPGTGFLSSDNSIYDLE